MPETETYQLTSGKIVANITIEDVPQDKDDPYGVGGITRQAVVRDFKYQVEDGRSFSFDSLLPEGWRFVDAGRCPEMYVKGARASRREKIVYVPFNPSCWNLKDGEGDYAGIDAPGMRLGTLYLLAHASNFSQVTTEEKYHDSHNEDFNAWEKAILHLEKLRQEGIDLEPGMTLDEATQFANRYMSAKAENGMYS